MREIYISTTFIKDKKSVLQAIKILRQLNIRNIEIGSNHCYEKSYNYLQNYKFNFFLHNYFPVPKKDFIINIASLNKSLRNRSINQIKKSIKFAKLIKAKLYTFHPGFVTDPRGAKVNQKNYDFLWNKRKEMNKKVENIAWHNMVNSLKKIIKYAKKKGVKICIETEGSINAKNHLLMHKPVEFKKFMELFNSDDIGVNLNLAHLKLASRAFKFSKSNFINLIKKYIVAIEVSHNDNLNDDHKPLKQGGWYFKYLKMKNFESTPIILEFRNAKSKEIINSLKLLKNEI